MKDNSKKLLTEANRKALKELKYVYIAPMKRKTRVYRFNGYLSNALVTGYYSTHFVVHECEEQNQHLKLYRVTHLESGNHIGLELPLTHAKLLVGILQDQYCWEHLTPGTMRGAHQIVKLVKEGCWHSLRSLIESDPSNIF